jgi:energy-coupling factor transporter ATP-binding protein EcfA2
MGSIYPEGSEWRKWDFQVHTPASHLNNQFGDNWDEYVQKLFRAAITKNIRVLCITDYFTIDGYTKIKREYLESDEKLSSLFSPDEIAAIRQIRLLPNVEFRLNKIVGKSRINCHVILSDELSIADIVDHFLNDLKFTYEAEPQQTAEKRRLKLDNLRALGAKLMEQHEPFRKIGNPIIVGMMNAVVDDDAIFELLKNSKFSGKYLFGVVADEDLSRIGWDSQDHHSRKVLIQKSDILFSSNPSTKNWALALNPPYTEGIKNFIKEFRTLKPCVHGSDCHSFPEIGHPCAKRKDKGHTCTDGNVDCDLRFCWIKADPTFEGLKQILYEPSDRIHIGPTAPLFNDQARTITSVTISDSNEWFDDVTLPLNSGLLSIIGQKGSGKSALAELIAYAAGTRKDSDNDSFLIRAAAHLGGLKVELAWGDGHQSPAKLWDKNSGLDEVRYLSQRFVERLCAQDGISDELVREVENVIFSYLDPADTMNASDFEELRTLKTEAIRKEVDRLKGEIHRVIGEECELRIRQQKLPEKKARIVTLNKEKEGLLKQMPKAATPQEAELQKGLQETREALAKVQSQLAAERQKLQKIADIEASIASFKGQMDSFYTRLSFTLRELGIPESEHAKFKPIFSGDVQVPLNARKADLNNVIARLEGGDTPVSGTFKYLQTHLATLTARQTADKALLENIKRIQNRVAAVGSEVERLAAEVATTEGADRERIKEASKDRLNAYVAVFENMKREQQALEDLYHPIRNQLNDQAMLEHGQLELSIRWAVELKQWLERGAGLFDQRKAIPYGNYERMGEAACTILVPAWSSGDPNKIREKMEDFMAEFRKPDLPWKSYVRSEITLEDILNWLYEVNHISLNYGLKFNGADLESLSPGTKGIVLLILYLGLDFADTRPLIVDQPDENLDNESIYNLLMPYFKRAKARRQIIIITHNPNLVVNADSEQVIVATSTRRENGLPHIVYHSGSLEHTEPPDSGTRELVCKILEGGSEAFRKREQRYSLP